MRKLRLNLLRVDLLGQPCWLVGWFPSTFCGDDAPRDGPTRLRLATLSGKPTFRRNWERSSPAPTPPNMFERWRFECAESKCFPARVPSSRISCQVRQGDPVSRVRHSRSPGCPPVGTHNPRVGHASQSRHSATRCKAGSRLWSARRIAPTSREPSRMRHSIRYSLPRSDSHFRRDRQQSRDRILSWCEFALLRNQIEVVADVLQIDLE